MGAQSKLQQRINQLLEFSNDPAILAAIVIGGLLFFAFSFSENKRWWLVTTWIFCVALAKFLNSFLEWIVPPFPFNHIVNYGRTVGIIMSFAILPGAFYFYNRNRGARIPPAAFALFIFYMTYCVRFIPTPAVWEASSRALVYVSLFFFLGMSLPRWITDRQQMLKSMQAGAMAIVILCVLSAVSYGIRPTTASWNGRFFGLTSNPNLIGMYCALAMPVLFGLTLWKYDYAVTKLFWPIATGIVAIVLVWTGSRGPMIITAVAALIFFRAKLGNLIYFAVPVAASIWGISLVLEDSFQNVDRFTSIQDSRTAGWLHFYELWMQSPVFGNADLRMATVENSYLTVMANAGFPGVLACLFLVGVWGYTCLNLLRSKPADRNGQLIRDIAVSGLVAAMAAAVFEGILLSTYSPTTYWIYYYCAVAEFSRQYALIASPNPQFWPSQYYPVPMEHRYG